MSDLEERVPDVAAPAQRRNPWTAALAWVWSSALGLAVLVLLVASRTDDPARAGGLYPVAGVTFGIAVLVIAVHLGVRAIVWHLDPSSRLAAQEASGARQRLPRQDF